MVTIGGCVTSAAAIAVDWLVGNAVDIGSAVGGSGVGSAGDGVVGTGGGVVVIVGVDRGLGVTVAGCTVFDGWMLGSAVSDVSKGVAVFSIDGCCAAVCITTGNGVSVEGRALVVPKTRTIRKIISPTLRTRYSPRERGDIKNKSRTAMTPASPKRIVIKVCSFAMASVGALIRICIIPIPSFVVCRTLADW
ncbi:MAG: hypothetical protein NVSMB42_14550 [Herpetosiphon sp.]